MGFFSAFKKFFGGSSPDQKEAPQQPDMVPEKEEFERSAEEPELKSPQSASQDVGERSGDGSMDLDTRSPFGPADLVITPPVSASESSEHASASLAGQIGIGDGELLARLREAPPRLSVWLDIILEDMDEANDVFWSRLGFLLNALQAPTGEIEAFIGEFRAWLEKMEYYHVDEFRSELQYRLALALDLEDEEDERNRLLLKLGESLAKTREQFGRRLDILFSGNGKLDQAFWDELEELFIMADLGYDVSVQMVERLKDRARLENVEEPEGVRALLRAEVEGIFRQPRRITAVNKPEVILMIGVNGVGKTTTIAKLAHRERMRGKKTLIVAADTFRAAAIDQLKVWAERVGSDFYAKNPGSDPASVAWEGMDYALKNNIDTVFIDTAGRLQTKANLMEELSKIRQVLGKKHPGSPHRSILVLDATTGQNALSQARLFRESAGVNELILTKLDGTAKGGVAIAVAMREELPITFIGLGEKMEDLRPFNGADYADALLGNVSVSPGMATR